MFKKVASCLKKSFLNEKFIISVILINSIVIFLEESKSSLVGLETADLICTLIFIIEMTIKIREYGFKGYWKSGFNRIDFVLVILSIPSIILFFLPDTIPNLSFLLALRIFRIFRFFKLIHIFPNFTVIANNFKLALEQSRAIMLGFGVIIVTFAMIGSCLFSDTAPEYFATPLDGIYSTFRLFTVEGWYEIPDAIAEGMESPFWAHIIRLYFSLLLILGGIIGMSLINSIFVDAMVSDNNDDVKVQLTRMENKLDCLVRELEKRDQELKQKDELILEQKALLEETKQGKTSESEM